MHRRQSGIHQLFLLFFHYSKLIWPDSSSADVRNLSPTVQTHHEWLFWYGGAPVKSRTRQQTRDRDCSSPPLFFSFHAPVNPPLQTRQFSPTHFREPQNIHFGGDRENVSFRLLQIIMLSRLSKTKQRELPNKPRN